MLIFSGNANRKLAEEVAEMLGTKLSNAKVGRFADGECNIQVLDSIRGKDVYIVQVLIYFVTLSLLRLLLMKI